MSMTLGFNSLDLPKPAASTRVVVAMSGGVDSSVVATLLCQQGYEVIGVTLQLYDHGSGTHRKGACCAGQDIHDARRVAEALGFPHYVLDYESRFRAQVIDAFAASYAAGETPVPCIECNRTVKFKDLLEVARDLGADALATGHYIETRRQPDGRRAMFRPADLDRDQSYFLYATTQAQLDFLRFPLGRMTKAETREIARAAGFAIADKPDSQDICFVPAGRYDAIVEKLRPDVAQPGDILHLDGRVLGRHQGIHHFTIGQRRGLRLASAEPLHVIRLEAAGNRVIVGPRAALSASRLRLRGLNWLGDLAPERWPAQGVEAFVRVRSARLPCAATLRWSDAGAEVEISGGEESIAPGQACVVYEHSGPAARVLGGGTIDKVLADAPAGARAPAPGAEARAPI